MKDSFSLSSLANPVIYSNLSAFMENFCLSTIGVIAVILALNVFTLPGYPNGPVVLPLLNIGDL
jgi:hypothetical protein